MTILVTKKDKQNENWILKMQGLFRRKIENVALIWVMRLVIDGTIAESTQCGPGLWCLLKLACGDWCEERLA